MLSYSKRTPWPVLVLPLNSIRMGYSTVEQWNLCPNNGQILVSQMYRLPYRASVYLTSEEWTPLKNDWLSAEIFPHYLPFKNLFQRCSQS